MIALIGLQFEGRLGASFDFDFLVAHFLAIFGMCDPSHTRASARPPKASASASNGGPTIFQRMTQDPFSLLLGLGYGVPLTDFHSASGAVVREPHNSYITVIARTGIVGRGLLGLVMLSLIRRWHQPSSNVPGDWAGAKARTGC